MKWRIGMNSNLSAVVTNVQKFSVHDGPGIRSVVFLKGCPLNCEWCANPENINAKPELMVYPEKCIGCGRCKHVCKYDLTHVCRKNVDMCINCGKCTELCSGMARIIKGESMTTEQVIRQIDKDRVFYKNSGGGVTFSGGEAMLYPDFILEIASRCREEGYNSAVETCGMVPWDSFEKVLPYIDLFLYDLKFIDRDKHIKFCGKSNDMILENLKKLSHLSRVIVRIPVIPDINDSCDDLKKLSAFLLSLGEGVDEIHCLPYHNFGISKYDALGIKYSLEDIILPEQVYMENIKSSLECSGLKVQIGG